MVSIRHTIIALLTIIRAGAEKVLPEEDFSLSSLSLPQTPISLFEHRQAIPTETYLSQTPTIAPTALEFLLIENLLDLLLEELREHSRQCPKRSEGLLLSPTSYSDSTNNNNKDSNDKDFINDINVPLTRSLLEEREFKDRQDIFSESGRDLSEEDTEMREWAYQRYFLVWAITSILKVLRANLVTAQSSRLSSSSLGLGLSVGIEVESNRGSIGGSSPIEPEGFGGGCRLQMPRSDSFSSVNSSSTAGFRSVPSPSIPFVLRLLQHVETCIGLDLDSEADDSREDLSLDEVLKQTDGDALCSRILEYPPNSQYPPQSLSTITSDRIEQHSPIGYRHVLRISSVDCFVSGLLVFRPSQANRDSLLFNLLKKAPLASKLGYGPEYTPKLFGLLQVYCCHFSFSYSHYYHCY
jgi:hypothetical protein